MKLPLSLNKMTMARTVAKLLPTYILNVFSTLSIILCKGFFGVQKDVGKYTGYYNIEVYLKFGLLPQHLKIEKMKIMMVNQSIP